MDELSLNSRTRVIEVAGGKTEEWFVDATELGLDAAPIDAVAGGEPAENAEVVSGLLAGRAGPARDLAVLNGGAAILVAGGADDLAGGVQKAAESISSGAARDVLEKLAARSRELAGSG